MIWFTGGALVLCLVMIVGLVGMIVFNGLQTYWPRPIERVTMSTGEVFLGVPFDSEDEPERILYRTGNRDLGREPFRWVDRSDIASIERPDDALLVEREVWSIWLGVPEQAVEINDSGERIVVAEGAEDVMAYVAANHSAARSRRADIDRLKKNELGAINYRIEAQRLRVREAELALERPGGGRAVMPMAVFVLAVVGIVGCVIAGRVVGRRTSTFVRWPRVARAGLLAAAWAGALAVFLHGPWKPAEMTEARLSEMRASAAEIEVDLGEQYDTLLAEIREMEAIDARQRLVVIEPTEGRVAPVRQIEPDEPMLLSQVVRVVDANRMGLGRKLGVYFSRWTEFLTAPPREANTEGGVFPVIVGTVMLTLLLTVTVTPLGVIAALYLREYAKQGIVTSIIRIAVNNLAGVPSIVYGVFGLGFFCYTVGRYVDAGPVEPMRLPPIWWWGLVGVGMLTLVGSYACGVWSKPIPGSEASKAQVLLRRVAAIGWLMTFVLAVVLIARTPFFSGFFEARAADGSPTFGGRGMLWAALTLALLTLPVVIVSTEEAIAAVPNSMREGSYGCGASKWQTLWRIVLPGALPGILTGAILAMARGAGEVAPLMLVGAVKLNQDLPISGESPFLHLDRSFMHLGFHIYDLGFQSPDSQAARGLVWTTTLLLLVIVLTLNLVAIVIRAKLRARLTGPTV
ncbi:MAG: PstA family ABC transporter permease [Phycisphaerales bacterium]